MNISLCITVKNEEESIARLLDSIFAGTKLPSEIVIVDAKSTDKTVEVIKSYQEKHKNIKLIIEKGGTAHGRNLSIKNAKGEIIVQTDAGCVVKKDWLKKITSPFKDKSVDLVAGFYEMPAKSSLQEVLNVFHGVPPKDLIQKNLFHQPGPVHLEKKFGKKLAVTMKNCKELGKILYFFMKP